MNQSRPSAGHPDVVHPPQPARPLQANSGPALQRPGSAVPNMPPPPTHDPHLESIALDDDLETPPATKIRFSAGDLVHEDHTNKYKRKANPSVHGACRVRTFHGRLSDEGMNFMDTKINEWLDAHHDIDVKFVTTAVGPYEGKIKEPALVVNIWF